MIAKRMVLLAGLGTGLLLMAAARLSAAEHATPPVEHTAAAPAEGHGGGHFEIDERLVPIPPSPGTVVSAIWVLVIFLIMLAILYPTAWKNILVGLKKREQRIREDIANAEAARAKAEATLRDYQTQLSTAESKVREMISSAVVEGEKMAASIKARGQQEAEETRARAIKEIEAAKKQALSEIYQQAAELSTNIASKILRRNINAADQQDLVRRSLDELHTVRS